MRLTGHTSRTIFDRDPIIHEQERLEAEDELVASLARQAQAPRGRAPRTDNPCDGVAGEGARRWRSFGFVLGGGRVTRIRTAAGHSLSGWRPLARTVQDEQLLLEQKMLRDHRAHATGATQRRGHEENWEFETHR